MLKRIPLVFVMALLAIASSSVPAAVAQDAATKIKVTPDSQAKAKKVYAMDCALCHGATGDGKTDLAKDMQLTLIDWTDFKSLAGMPDETLFNVIRNGKDKMPPEEKGRATDDEVWNLIVYIRGFGKTKPAAAPAASAGPATAPGV